MYSKLSSFMFMMVNIQGIFGIIYEKQIQKQLLADYNPAVRPEDKPNSPIVIHFDTRIQKLVNLDVRRQVLTINTFTMLRWEDPQLRWNISYHGNVDTINMMSTDIWTPDVTLYNTADIMSLSHTDYYKTKVLVRNDGTAIWYAPVTWMVSCEVDITWFPVDKQVCNMSFGSNSYSKKQMILKFWSKPSTKTELFSDHFSVDSGEWTIDSITSYEDDLEFSCCPLAYSSISYQIIFLRMSLYYFLYIILPLISLAFLFLLVFHIPADSGERMGFGVTILLSITVYLLVISEKLPEKSDVYPMLGICFIVIFYVLCCALACAAMTTILSRRIQKPPEFLLDWIDTAGKKVKKVEPKASTIKRCIQSCRKRCWTSEEEKKCEEDGVKHTTKETEEIEEPTTDYNEKWVKICRKADKYLFIFYCLLLFFIPIIITVALPKDGMS